MSMSFSIMTRRKNGNLHIDISGEFDGTSAWELVNAINDNYAGAGRIVINTDKVSRVAPFGVAIFIGQFPYMNLPGNVLAFEGVKAKEIFSRNRLLLAKKKPGICGRTSRQRNSLVSRSGIM